MWSRCIRKSGNIPCAGRNGNPPHEDERTGPYLVGGGLSLGWVDFDAALEVGAVLDADARRGNISYDRAIFLDVDAAAGVEIPDDFAVNDHLASLNFEIELGGRAYVQFVTQGRDGASQ